MYHAFIDLRVRIIAPIIAVQSFKWSILNDSFHARAASIPLVFNHAAIIEGKKKFDAETVKNVFDKIAPGLTTVFDGENIIQSFAPR